MIRLGARFAAAAQWVAPMEGDPVMRWRQRLLGETLLVSAIVAFVVVATAIPVTIRGRLWGILVADVGTYALLLVVLFARRLPYVVRATGLVTLNAGLGAYLVLSRGLEGSGIAWLVSGAAGAALLLGRHAAMRVVAAIGLVFTVVGWQVATGAAPWAVALRFGLGRWLLVAFSVLGIASFLSLAIVRIFEGLGRESLARAATEAARARLAEVIDQGGSPVVLVDLRGDVAYANAAARAEGLDAIPIPALAPWDAVVQGAAWSGTVDGRTGEGRPLPLSGSLSPVRGDDGEVVQVLATLRDVRRERALEERARHDQRLAAIGTLAGGIAHDVNNLLQPIVANVELARDQLSADHPAREALRDVDAAAARARRLVRRIVSFARPEPEARAPLDLGELVEETARLLRAALPPGIRLVTDACAPVVVEAEPAELQQVLLNLATNAAQAMPAGGIIRLEVARVPAAAHAALAPRIPGAADVARLTVADEGTGMDAQTVARIFEPFFTTKAPGEGTGLGLASVRDTITALGGAMLVESALGAGTRMHVCLPLAARPRPATVDTAVVSAAPAAGGAVLLVDDEEPVRRAVVRLLERQRWRVRACAGGDEALETLARAGGAVDVVLTDYSMPGMTGAALAVAVRQRWPALPVVLMTGYADDVATGEAAASALAGVLRKPFTAEELAGTLARATAADR